MSLFVYSYFDVLMRRFTLNGEAEENGLPAEPCSDDEPIHILMVALKTVSSAATDEELSNKFRDFCSENVNII